MWATALLLGLAGSLHCAGMCSPLLLAATRVKNNVIINRLLYNSGRILTYSLLGAFAGFAGYLPISKFQGLFSILLGLILVIVGLTGTGTIRIPLLTWVLNKFSGLMKALFGGMLHKKGYATTFVLGSLNGILPCGLTFLALMACIILPGPQDGFLFMLLFGLGTLPVMLGAASIFNYLLRKSRFNINKVTTSLLILSGVLLIARVLFTHVSHAPSVQQGLVDIVLCR